VIVAIELGMIYGIMALGVYLTFRILDFPDLTLDGSFTAGAAVTAALIIDGVPPLLATLAGFCMGAVAGWVTGILHTKGKINGLLAGILTQIAFYSINLRIMGGSNLSLIREETLITPLRDARLLGTWVSIAIFAGIALVLKLILDWFLNTNKGLAIRATGDKEGMIRSFGVNTDRAKIWILVLSNGLIGLSGGLIAQYQGFVDIGMGIGLVLVGVASVIIGQAIFTSRNVVVATFAVIVGAVLYRLVITFALSVGFDPNDMKLVSAVLVILALTLPRWGPLKRLPSLRQFLPAAKEPLRTS
jgi:putative ABC transport system permease protein